jgi:hypothetical protein
MIKLNNKIKLIYHKKKWNNNYKFLKIKNHFFNLSKKKNINFKALFSIKELADTVTILPIKLNGLIKKLKKKAQNGIWLQISMWLMLEKEMLFK